MIDIASFVIEERNLVDRNVNKAGVGIKRHRVPVMRAGWAGYDCIERQVHRLFDQHGATVLIKLSRGPVLVGKGCGRNQLAVRGIQHVEETILRRLHHDAPVCTTCTQRQIGQHDLLRGGVIPAIPGRCLVVPAVSSRIGIHCEDRGQEEIVPIAIRIADIWVPG